MSLASVKSRLISPFWYRLTHVVPEKGPLNVCVCVRACVRVCVCIIQRLIIIIIGWLSSRVVSALDSGAERAWVQIAAATLSGNSLRQTVHTHRASVHQAAKLVAALLRVAGITAGLADRLPPGL